MEALKKITGLAAKMPISNIDTDMIIPKLYLRTIKRSGLGKVLFYEMRFDSNGVEKPNFILNQQPFTNSKIIIAGDNFGCGSSREHAPWALKDFGIDVIISTSYADIFYNNCFKNAILPAIVTPEDLEKLLSLEFDKLTLTVDLTTKTIVNSSGLSIGFEISPERQKVLLEGLDDIALTEQKMDKIKDFENQQKKDKFWLYSSI